MEKGHALSSMSEGPPPAFFQLTPHPVLRSVRTCEGSRAANEVNEELRSVLVVLLFLCRCSFFMLVVFRERERGRGGGRKGIYLAGDDAIGSYSLCVKTPGSTLSSPR